MDTNINFTNDLNGESDVKTSFNLPRKIYNLTAGRAVADGASTVEAESCTYETMLNIDRTRLLNEASLLLLPNTYKEGKLYSHKPLNGNGDFTVTRATTATRVNSAGLVDLVPYNLLQQSEMFSQAIWTKQRANILANTITAPNGTLTADKLIDDTTASSTHQIRQSISVQGGEYTMSIYAKKAEYNYIRFWEDSISGRQCYFDLENGVATNVNMTSVNIQNVGDGWYLCSAVLSVSAGSFGYRINLTPNGTTTSYNGTGTDGIYIWGAQLVEGTSARDYLRTETRLNIPRIDYSLEGCPNILLEPQRTNLALQSSSFDNATWTKTNSSITANSTTSPSGVVDADTFSGDGTNNQHQITQSASVTSGVTYTTSVYAKKNTNNFIQIYNINAFFGSNAWANFDLNNGVLGSVGSATTAKIENVGNGWYRCTITAAATSSGTSATSFFHLITSATSARGESNTLSTSVFLWGAQLEAGAYATSYIPTTTASVTRNADVLQLNGASALIGQTQGTMFCELRIGASDASGSVRNILSISDGTANNRIEVYRFNNTIQYDYVSGGVIQFTGSVFTITNFNTTLKIAIRYSLNNVKTFINGVLVSTDTTALIPACNQVNVGSNRIGSPTTIYGGFINEMALFPTPLTDAQCILITS